MVKSHSFRELDSECFVGHGGLGEVSPLVMANMGECLFLMIKALSKIPALVAASYVHEGISVQILD